MQGKIRTRRTASLEPLLADPEIEKIPAETIVPQGEEELKHNKLPITLLLQTLFCLLFRILILI